MPWRRRTDDVPNRAGDWDKIQTVGSANFQTAQVPLDLAAEEKTTAFQPHRFKPHIQLLTGRVPRVLIELEAYKRMCLYVELAPLEVGWLGTAIRNASGDFQIEEVFLLEQEVSASHTELSTEGYGKLSMALLEKGDAIGEEQVTNLRFWGHSHVRMATFASITDDLAMTMLRKYGLPWAIRGIFNKNGWANFSVDLMEQGLRFLDVPWDVFDKTTGTRLNMRGHFLPLESQSSQRFALPEQAPQTAPPQSAVPEPSTSLPVQPSQSLGASAQPRSMGLPLMPLPEIFKPSAFLRAQVEEEYKSKVIERRPGFGSGFGVIRDWFTREGDK